MLGWFDLLNLILGVFISNISLELAKKVTEIEDIASLLQENGHQISIC